MSASGNFNTSDAYNGGTSPDRMRLQWTRTVSGNNSVVSWNVRGWGGVTGYYTNNHETKVTVNGTVGTKSATNMYHNAIYYSGSKTIAHDADGNATLTISVTGRIFYNTVNSTGSQTWTLDRIPKAPTVSTSAVSNIQDDRATFAGNISDSGGATVTDAGVYVSATDTTPDSNDLDADSNGDHSGSFSAVEAGLSPNTLYYYRAYAVNSVGTSYGTVGTFTTNELAEIETDPVTNLAGTTATFNGDLKDNGRPNITEKGFYYSTTDTTPDANDSKVVVAGAATGEFNANVTGLSASSTYYVRAFAVNSEGTAVGATRTFTTVVLPGVVTSPAADIDTTEATLHGSVSNEGGGSVSDRGFVYSTSANPTTSDTKVPSGDGIGGFSEVVTGLTPGVVYHFRSYAINEAGTAYGANKFFDTVQTPPQQPSNKTPSGGEGSPTLTPELSWQYNAGSANDTQSAYQISVKRISDDVVVWNSNKVTSGDQSVVYAGDPLVFGVEYGWIIQTWNQADLSSPYSSQVLFITSEIPSVTVDAPVDNSSVSSNTPLVEWSYSDNEATTQAKYRVRVLDGVIVVDDSGWLIGSDTSFQIPDGVLDNSITYDAEVTVEDGHGMVSNPATSSFTLDFLSPSNPTVQASSDPSGISLIDVNLQDTINDAWYAETISVWRQTFGSEIWEKIITEAPVLQNILDDSDVPSVWSESGVGVTASAEVGKYGSGAVGFGAGATGQALYSKTLNVSDLDSYDKLQAFVNVVDSSLFSSIEFKLETDTSNYYMASIPASSLIDGSWNAINVSKIDWTVVGTPDDRVLGNLSFSIEGATSAIPVGDVQIDQIRLVQTNYLFKDFETASGDQVRYSVNAKSSEASVSSARIDSEYIVSKFSEDPIFNTYLVPVGSEEKMVKGWVDGESDIQLEINNATETYQPIGAEKAFVINSGSQDLITGAIEIRFFDEHFGGQGLTGVDVLREIMKTKPIILKTWFGRNYRISIDGQISVSREPGVYWAASFNFTEIE